MRAVATIAARGARRGGAPAAAAATKTTTKRFAASSSSDDERDGGGAAKDAMDTVQLVRPLARRSQALRHGQLAAVEHRPPSIGRGVSMVACVDSAGILQRIQPQLDASQQGAQLNDNLPGLEGRCHEAGLAMLSQDGDGREALRLAASRAIQRGDLARCAPLARSSASHSAETR